MKTLELSPEFITQEAEVARMRQQEFDGCPIVRPKVSLSQTLTEEMGFNVWIADDTFQPSGSYKDRGAFNNAFVKADNGANLLLAVSAGNHAQGSASAAKSLQIETIVCCPETTSQIKLDGILRLGGNFVDLRLMGDSFDDCMSKALGICEIEGAELVHPFDDIETITGQATLGLDVLDAVDGRKFGAVFCPVGGGGLISGVGSVLKFTHADTQLFAVEPAGAASMAHALRKNQVADLEMVDGFVEGASTRRVGQNTFEIAKMLGVLPVGVSNEMVCRAVLELDSYGFSAEAAGALSLAGLRKAVRENLVPGNLNDALVIISGKNGKLTKYKDYLDTLV